MAKIIIEDLEVNEELDTALRQIVGGCPTTRLGTYTTLTGRKGWGDLLGAILRRERPSADVLRRAARDSLAYPRSKEHARRWVMREALDSFHAMAWFSSMMGH